MPIYKSYKKDVNDDSFFNIINTFLDIFNDASVNVKEEYNDKDDNVVIIKDIRTPNYTHHYNKKNETKFTPLYCPRIKEVLFNNPATIVWFEDGSKSVAIAGHGDKYDKEVGLTTCILKRILGNKEYRKIMDKYCYTKTTDEKRLN